MTEIIPKYSIVVAIYNRPDEVEELLFSLSKQQKANFEVIIIEDGSSLNCKSVVDRYKDKLSIQYHVKPNTGPGHTRNVGVSMARGEYIVFFDSDCIIPEDYFIKVEHAMCQQHFDAWGGPDKASKDFNSLQKAISHTMTSYITTGGIRGGKNHLSWFEPRSFNFGIKKNIFNTLEGFHYTKIGEDIDLSLRMKKAGVVSILIPDAFVYHKRRTSLSKFFKQIFIFGRSRVLVNKVHPGSIKLFHLFPLFFSIGFFSLPLLPIFSLTLFKIALALYLIFFFAVATECAIKTKSIYVSFIAIAAAWIQMIAYGSGFMKELFFKSTRVRITDQCSSSML